MTAMDLEVDTTLIRRAAADLEHAETTLGAVTYAGGCRRQGPALSPDALGDSDAGRQAAAVVNLRMTSSFDAAAQLHTVARDLGDRLRTAALTFDRTETAG